MTAHKRRALSAQMRERTGHKKALLPLISLILLSLVLSASVRGNASAGQKGFLWEVRSKTATVYLLGSVHVFKKELYPLPGNIEKAFQGSDTLVVEANIDEINLENLMTMLEGAFYPEDETLEKHLSKETYSLAEAKLAEFGIPIQLFQRSRPWVVALMITSLEVQRSGFDAEYGIDKHFLNKARDRKKILELESIGYQISLFNGFPEAEQEAFLLYTLKDVDVMKGEMDAVVKAWIAGDTKAMESVVTKGLREDPRVLPVHEKLFYERNRNMASRIEEFLKTGGKHFVVVGAGHLVGNEGIPELLRRKGYSVEQR